MNKKIGKISFDTIMIVSVMAFVIFVCVAVAMFYYNRQMNSSGQHNIYFAYNAIVKQVRLDSNIAAVALPEPNAVILLDKNAEPLCKYQLKEAKLIRLDKQNRESVLFNNIESITFSVSQDLPNLLTIKIFPLNKNHIPFFTSFALRGSNNDME